MPIAELADALCLKDVTSHRWNVFPSCATTGDGLHEGFDWLKETLKNSPRKVQPEAASPTKDDKPTNNIRVK